MDYVRGRILKNVALPGMSAEERKVLVASFCVCKHDRPRHYLFNYFHVLYSLSILVPCFNYLDT